MQEEAFIRAYVVDEDILVIRLHGSLDASSTDEFNNEVQTHLEEGRSKVIIDCAHLDFVSSLGIGALMVLQTRLGKRGGAVKLAAIHGPAAKVLRVVQLDKVLGIYGDIEFARQSFYV